MPLQATSGAASYDGFGGGVAAVPNYIEDVFSTYLYQSTGSTPTIVNGIDLAGKGGMVWIKDRSQANDNNLMDTANGGGSYLISNATTAQQAFSSGGYSDFVFNSNGFIPSGIGSQGTYLDNFATWTFRKQPKFFDVVTWTGDGTGNRNIPHNLGSVPGCIMMKKTSAALDWYVYHRGLNYPNAGSPQSNTLKLNTTDAGLNSTAWQSGPTSTYFPVLGSAFNVSGATYVAYLFAHDAGGFGLTGTDNVISCGSATSDSNRDVAVTLGWEPQWILWKRTNNIGGWYIVDNMRGLNASKTGTDQPVARGLLPNTTGAEGNNEAVGINATGFAEGRLGTAGDTYIYIAIRRGPMKVPTDATKVFSPALYTGTGSTNTITSPFPSDLLLVPNRAGQFYSPSFWDRLRGATKFLRSPGTDAEATSTDGLTSFSAAQNSVAVGADATYGNINFSGRNYVPYFFRRAPSFFDEVCYTGTGSAQTLTHNLGVAPELMIIKSRLYSGSDWAVYAGDPNQYLRLNTTNASAGASNTWNYLSPTSTQFSVGNSTLVGASGWTYVAYLFATCAGVSKVGSYTGNGSTQTINCGFTGGARFVLLKATSTTGNWMVYDTARGMTTLTDPFLSLNSTSSETATLGACTTVSTGFAVNESILAGVNTNGVSFVYLAIA